MTLDSLSTSQNALAEMSLVILIDNKSLVGKEKKAVGCLHVPEPEEQGCVSSPSFFVQCSIFTVVHFHFLTSECEIPTTDASNHPD